MYLHGTRYLFFHTVGVEVGKTGLGYYAGHLKVHKIEIFFGFDFEICIISLLVMSKY